MFQPGLERRREQDAEARPRKLKLRLVLALPPGALAGKERADHSAARSLDLSEIVARARGEQDGQRAQREVTEKDLHGEPTTWRKTDRKIPVGRECDGMVRSMTALTVLGVACRIIASARLSSDRPPAPRPPSLSPPGTGRNGPPSGTSGSG